MRVVRNLRRNLRGFLGGGGGVGGGVEPIELGGAVCTFVLGGGGVRGTFCGGTVELELGVTGFEEAAPSLELEPDVGNTGPGGGGSEVLELAEPGRTMVFESAMLGF